MLLSHPGGAPYQAPEEIAAPGYQARASAFSTARIDLLPTRKQGCPATSATKLLPCGCGRRSQRLRGLGIP